MLGVSGKDGRSPWGLASENQRMFQGAEHGMRTEEVEAEEKGGRRW